jgi:hypothetical protein
MYKAITYIARVWLRAAKVDLGGFDAALPECAC